MDDIVKYGFEVIKEDGVGGAFEDKSEAPVWVDAAASCYTSSGDGSVGKEKDYGEELVFWLAGDLA